MNTELLRDALDQAAATVTRDGLRPLAAPVRRRRRVAPFAVLGTAAVLSLVLVAALVRPSKPGPPPTNAAPGRMMLAAYAGARYALVGGGILGKPVAVHDAATGKEIASVPAPAGQKGYWDVTGTGDNRTFFLSTFDHVHSAIDLYRLHLRENGTPERPEKITTVSGRRGLGEHMIAASGGGARLAVVTVAGARDRYTATGASAVTGRRTRESITVLSPATGGRKVVALPPGDVIDELVWAPDGRHFVYDAGGPVQRVLNLVDSTTGTVRAIDLGTAGAELGRVTPDARGGQLVTVTFDQGRARLIWYSFTDRKITRTVPLATYRPPGRPQTMGPFMSGDTAVVLIGDTVYRVTGTVVRRQQAASGTFDAGRTSTW